MSADAGLLLLSVASAFLFISARFTCLNPVHCSCGNEAETFTACADEQNTTAADPCTQWPGCKTCSSNKEGSSCSKDTNRTLRRKRQYPGYGRPRRPPIQSPRNPIQGQRRGDCSGDVDHPEFGSILCETGRGRKTCTGTCLPGYTFENSNGVSEMDLSCLDGRWTPARTFPPCISGGHCDLVVMGHGRFNCTTEMQGTRCDVFCARRNAGRFSCYPGRPWEPPLPRCVRPKGDDSGTGEVRQQCRCEYGASCDSYGHCVCPAGSTGTLCESIIAERQACGDPGFIANGYRRHLDGTESRARRTFQDGESLVFGCRSEEYALQGSAFMTCRDGQWSESLPRCIQSPVTPEVICPDLGQVVNADRLNTDGSPSLSGQSYRPGQSVVYTCHEGYALQRSSLITCQASGFWSSSLPNCMPIRSEEHVIRTTTASPDQGESISFCRDPGQVLNGDRSPLVASNGRGFPQGSSLEYSCTQGYVLKGKRSLFCMVGGSWSSTKPTCEGQPGSEVSGGNEYCLNPGDFQSGKIVHYPDINSRRGSEDSLDEPEYPPGTRLVYSCNEGYQLQGPSEITCQGHTSLWSTDPPTCELPVSGTSTEVVYCKTPGTFANGQRMHFSSLNSRTGSPQGSTDDPEYPEGTRFEYSCDAGYTMVGRRSQTCEKGRWSSPKPTCQKVSARDMMYCGNPGPINNGRVEYFPPISESGSSISISEDDMELPDGTQLEYLCEDGFILIGSNALSCLPTGQWSSDPPICSEDIE